MRRIVVPILILLVSACSSFKEVDRPLERWAVAAASYTSAVQALTALADTGVMKPEDIARAELGRKVARTALDTAQEAIIEAKTTDAELNVYINKALGGIAEIWMVVDSYRKQP